MNAEPLSQAVILSAGLGTRLMPLTQDCPKVMLPVKGKPLLEHHIRWLSGYGIQEILINLHYQPDVVSTYFGDGRAFGVRITYSREEHLLGTAGALDAFRNRLRGNFLVHYGDVYSELDVARFDRFHRDGSAAATLVVHPSSHPHDSDIVQLDADCRVMAIHHKPGSAEYGNLGSAACYLLHEKTLRYIPGNGIAADFMRDVFPAMIAAKELVRGYNTADLLYDMGTSERYARLQGILT